MDKRLKYFIIAFVSLLLVAFIAAFIIYRRERAELSPTDQRLKYRTEQQRKESTADSLLIAEGVKQMDKKVDNAKHQQHERKKIESRLNKSLADISMDTSVLRVYIRFKKSIARLDSTDKAGGFFLHSDTR